MVRGLDRGYPPGEELKDIFREAPAAHWKENSEESGDLGWPSPLLAAVQGILPAWRPSVLLYGLEARRVCHQLFHRVSYTASQESGKTGVLAASRICLTSKESEGTLECIWDPRPCPLSSFLEKAGKNRL